MEIMKKWMTAILSICVMVLMFGGQAFAAPEDEDQTIEVDSVVYKVDGDELTVIDYKGDATSLIIPDIIDGKTVTSIGRSAFWGKKNLVSIEIPDGVTSIGESAFHECMSLGIVTIPDSVTNIGDEAFGECTSLKSIEIPKGVMSIGDETFYNCCSLESVTVPNSVTSIGERAFRGCSSLKSVEIPYGVMTIGANAFSYCSGLESIKIPDSVTNIGDYAFSLCENAKFYVVEDSYAEVYLEDNEIEYEYYVVPEEDKTFEWGNFVYKFYGNELTVIGYNGDATSLMIPQTIGDKTVKSIGENAFRNNTSIVSVDCPDTVESIGDFAFHGCSNLSYLDVPADLQTIGYHAFAGCVNLSYFWFPAGLISIGDLAFFHCVDLGTVKFHSSMVVIGEDSFLDCDNAIFIVESGSSAETYFNQNNIDYYHELSVTNNNSGFNVESAYYKNGEGDKYLYAVLEGNAYHELFKGTYKEAVTNGDNTDEWIHGKDTIDGRYEFKIPVADGEAYIPIVSISDEYYHGYLNGDNSLERAFYPRYVRIDAENETLETGDYQYTADLEVTDNSDEDKKISLSKAALNTISVPQSANYKCLLELTMADDTYDMAFVGDANYINKRSETIDIGEGGIFSIPVKWAESIEDPDSVKSLLDDTFALSFHSKKDCCWHIYNFTVDEDSGMLEIEFVDEGLKDYEYKFSGEGDNDEVIITKYKGVSKNVVIPDNIEGKPVTSIGEKAFSYCDKITSVEIPDTVTIIDESAFHSCESLESIKIPDSVQSIGDYTFNYCTSLKSIVVDSNNSYFESRNNCNAIILKGYEELIAGCKNTVIPDGVKSIGESAFCGSGISAVKIPNSVKSIGNNAFFSCSSLKSVEIPNGVTSIGDDAFDGCSSLESIELPDGLTSIGYCAFDGCSSLKSIVIPESVTSIDEFAFNGCNNAKFYVAQGSYAEVYLKENNIPYEYYKFNLTVTNNDENVKLTKAVLITIGNPESEDYKRTLELTMDDDTYKSAFVGYADEIDDESDVIAIGEGNVFTLPVSNVVSFYCEKTDKWHICRFTVNEEESTLVIEPVDYKYTVYDDYVEITKYIGTDTDVVIPDTIEGKPVTSIVDWAFLRCTDLISIVIPDTVTSIGEAAFVNCISLGSIEIPDSVTTIGEGAFYGCGLTSIEIPDSVTSIGDESFAECSSLTSIKVDRDNKYYDSRNNCNAIIEKSSGKLIAGCVNTVIPNGVTSIGVRAFSGCDSMTSIVIPDSVKEIDEYAFSLCTSLESINIPKGVTKISDGTFINCRSLTSIEIPEGVTSIGDGAFCSCESLTSVEIPKGVKSIGKEAFNSCTRLESIKIPSSVTSIGDRAFNINESTTFPLYVVKGSYAEEYAKNNNYPYNYFEEPEDPTEDKSEATTEKKENTTEKSDTVKAPKKAVISKLKNIKKKKLSVKWKKVTGAKGYEVQYSTNKKFKKAKTKTTKKTTFVIKKLKKKKTYYVRVRAYTIDASGKKVPGKWSKVKKVKVTK